MPAADPTDDEAALSHLQELIARHTRRLQKLELKAATYGPLTCPAEIEMEIEDIREQIVELLRRADSLRERVRIQRRRLIVICDPAIEIADSFRRGLLWDLGDTYDVLTAFSSADVLTIARNWPVALLITEACVSGRRDAFDVVAPFKTHAPSAPVIVVTGVLEIDLEARARQHGGIDVFLRKPVALSDLRGAVRAMLDRATR